MSVLIVFPLFFLSSPLRNCFVSNVILFCAFILNPLCDHQFSRDMYKLIDLPHVELDSFLILYI